MFDTGDMTEFRLSNAKVVTEDAVLDGSVLVSGGVIAEIGAADAKRIDLRGDYVIPGLVDLHTDHVEKHVFPRNGVIWSPSPALAAHDGVVVAGGVTTVFDSLCVGACLQKSERRDLLLPLVAALQAGQASDVYRADHLLHLRCEICDPATVALIDQVLSNNSVHLVSVMDHTPGDRQCLDIDDWIGNIARDMKASLETAGEMTRELLDRSKRVGPSTRAHVIAAAKRANIPVMSHDDRTIDHVAEALAEGVAISEFPTTLEAAAHAREVGQSVVVGAPNYVRGGSQSGNVSVKDLLAEGLVDALASDYVPSSLMTAAFAIADDPDLAFDLPQALALVSARPADMSGLNDRGRIAANLRADLVRVRHVHGHAHVIAAWREGRRVY